MQVIRNTLARNTTGIPSPVRRLMILFIVLLLSDSLPSSHHHHFGYAVLQTILGGDFCLGGELVWLVAAFFFYNHLFEGLQRLLHTSLRHCKWRWFLSSQIPEMSLMRHLDTKERFFSFCIQIQGPTLPANAFQMNITKLYFRYMNFQRLFLL